MIIQNGIIHDAIHPQPYQADIAIRGGVIETIGKGLAALEGEEIIDATGRQVYPGLVDAHSHLGLEPYGTGTAEKDCNEITEPITPQLRGLDSFNPMDEAVQQALAGGVTTVGTGPGSGNILGGAFFATNTNHQLKHLKSNIWL